MIRHRLDNGIRVVLEPMSSCRSVAFGIWVKTGSRYEPDSWNGVSHFIEHMLFKGTDRFSAKEIAETFDSIGGNVNAFTTKEYTCYYAKVLDEHLPIAVDVLADMFFRSRLDETELAKERNVILEEIAMYDDTPDDLVHDLIARAAFGTHPLGYAVLGTERNLKQLGRGELLAYIRDHYTSGRIVVAAAGNVDVGRTIELVERHFGAHPPDDRNVTSDPPTFQGGTVVHRKQTEQNHLCLALPGCRLDDPRYYAVLVLNNALGGSMSSRLFQEIRERRGLAYSVYSYHTAYTDSGLLTIYAGTAPRQTAAVLELVLEILSDIRRNGLSQKEWSKAKEQLKGHLLLSLESTSSRMNRLGKNELLLGRHEPIEDVLKKIEAVTQHDVHEAAESMFGVQLAAALVGPADDALSAYGGRLIVA
ncbi:MAG: peptidase M16 [Candidatus Reconcilbacillus cellulovorans]|uniref:Peptidase M16 n=1 Tax=Candidatus Reconcilbacillus cellulovorans TaxID=1906605 RepID=A0A2A6E0D2_9BACL|nr:MAG: peptidase M16 [Candidatus Reconcilbacillus cellulovorans]